MDESFLSVQTHFKREWQISSLAWNTALEMEVKNSFIKFPILNYVFNW